MHYEIADWITDREKSRMTIEKLFYMDFRGIHSLEIKLSGKSTIRRCLAIGEKACDSEFNPAMQDPLEGQGVVLIDEIELHMHVSWQRKIINVLKRTFPNIQFVITTHSPQVLGEVTADYNVFMLEREREEIRFKIL